MQIHHPVLIIGQGIAGTLLSFMLYKAGIPFHVIDSPGHPFTSAVSGAVLNPFSGKTRAGVQRRSSLYDTAMSCYQELEQLLGVPVLEASTLVFFDSDREAQPEAQDVYQDYFRFDHSVHICPPVAIVHNEPLLKAWREWLQDRGLLTEAYFEEAQLQSIADGVWYQGQTFAAAVYCTGSATRHSTRFSRLRFTANRGDVLHLHIEGLPDRVIFNKGKLRLIPKGVNRYWCGSNYNWNYTDLEPDQAWRKESLQLLEEWLKVPFQVLGHQCAERPTTVGQIPFVGWHPLEPRIGICNGLGTKGFSAGPAWIADFVAVLQQGGQTQYQSVLDKFLH